MVCFTCLVSLLIGCNSCGMFLWCLLFIPNRHCYAKREWCSPVSETEFPAGLQRVYPGIAIWLQLDGTLMVTRVRISIPPDQIYFDTHQLISLFTLFVLHQQSYSTHNIWQQPRIVRKPVSCFDRGLGAVNKSDCTIATNPLTSIQCKYWVLFQTVFVFNTNRFFIFHTYITLQSILQIRSEIIPQSQW